MTKAAFIGLGSMGGPQARLIARSAFDLAVYDPYPAALQAFSGSARLAASPADAAEGAEFASICVRDEAQVRDVLFGTDGLADGLPAGALVLIHSTIAAQAVRDIAKTLADRGLALIDAPVSRTRQGEDVPFVISLLGGTAADVARARALVACFSTEIEHMGPLGAGMAAKIANNLVTWTHIVIGIQATAMASANGVGAEKLAAIMRANGNLTPPVASVIQSKFGAPAPAGPARAVWESQGGIGEKDLLLAMESAAAAGVDPRMIRETRALVLGAMRDWPAVPPPA